MITYAFYNVKGGVGKTTSAAAVAHILASQCHKRVLLVDLDPQSNLSNLFGSEQPELTELIHSVFMRNDLSVLNTYPHTVGDLLTDPDLDVNKAIVHTGYEGLDLIPSFLTLAEIEEKLKADIRTPQQFRLKAHLENVKETYDYCILDCSPSISIININGLAMTDYVFTPLRSDLWGIAGCCIAQNLIRTVRSYNPSLCFGGCFFTQFQAQTSVSRQLRQAMTQVMGDQYIDIPIRKSVKVEEMTYEHRALADYAPRATATCDYAAFTNYLVDHF